jgi:hypothetical protein
MELPSRNTIAGRCRFHDRYRVEQAQLPPEQPCRRDTTARIMEGCIENLRQLAVEARLVGIRSSKEF